MGFIGACYSRSKSRDDGGSIYGGVLEWWPAVAVVWPEFKVAARVRVVGEKKK